MNDVNQSLRRTALAAAAIVVVALFVGFAVLNLFGGGRKGPPDSGSGTADQGSGASGRPVDITALLPDSEDELQRAADVAREFTAAYFGGGKGRAQRLDELATPGYADVLTREAPAPLVEGQPVAAPKTASKAQVAAEIIGIRDLAEGSVTYIVRADVTASGGAEHRFEYAATVAERDGRWKVSGFYDAALGDAGVR